MFRRRSRKPDDEIGPAQSFLRIAVLAHIAAAVLVTTVLSAASAQMPASPDARPLELAQKMTGEWIGVCEQSTDGQPAENKFFHAMIRQTGPNTLEGKFSYYKADPATGEPVDIGDATAAISIEPDGTIKNNVSGTGVVLVEKKPKRETHQLAEVLTMTEAGTLSGRITGKISVDGLPFGLGKNGQVSDGSSTWTLRDDVLTINQTMTAGFRILFYKKTFTIAANSTARRGSDVAALTKASRLAAKPGCSTSGS